MSDPAAPRLDRARKRLIGLLVAGLVLTGCTAGAPTEADVIGRMYELGGGWSAERMGSAFDVLAKAQGVEGAAALRLRALDVYNADYMIATVASSADPERSDRVVLRIDGEVEVEPLKNAVAPSFSVEEFPALVEDPRDLIRQVREEVPPPVLPYRWSVRVDPVAGADAAQSAAAIPVELLVYVSTEREDFVFAFDPATGRMLGDPDGEEQQ